MNEGELNLPAGLDVQSSAVQLRRYLSAHRAVMRALAGWLIATPRYEDKYAFGYQLWDHARHALAIQHRLSELRGGFSEASIEPRLDFALSELPHARDTGEFVDGLHVGLLGVLQDAYATHLGVAHPAANAPEIILIRQISSDLQRHQAWAGGRLEPGSAPDAAWREYLLSLLSGGFGLDGASGTAEPHSRPHSGLFRRPATILTDERIRRGGLLSFEDRRLLSYTEEVAEQFKVFFNEMYAACILASVLFDASASAVPLDFLCDVAHHCWDEVRHSEFGAVRLRELGLAPTQLDPILYEEAEGMPFMHRFCHLTLNLEVFFMPRKRPRKEQYEAAGDTASRLFADVDWSDEINHVRYGKRWTEWFLKDDARSIDDLKEEVEAYLLTRASYRERRGSALAPF